MKILKPMGWLLAVVLFIGTTAQAQNTIQHSSTTFISNPEEITAAISHEKIIISISEKDVRDYKGHEDNCDNCLTGNQLGLEIDFTRPFKFPITEEDSVFVYYSTIQQNLAEYEFQQKQIAQMNAQQNETEKQTLNNSAQSIEAKSMEIAQLMQTGQISPEEAQKRILALTEPLLEDVDNSSSVNVQNEEFVFKPNFTLLIHNEQSKTETEAFSGYVHIQYFDKERFVATFKGIEIESCTTVDKKECANIESQYLPDKKVIREGQGSLMLDLNIKEFNNDR